MDKCVRKALGCVGLFLLLVVSVTGLRAQVVSTATILGTVTDSSGAAVVGATVTVKNTDTGVTNTAVTDAQGRYNVPELIIGNYEVDVEANGFKKAVHSGITLTVGSQNVVDATLEVGTVQQTVTVEADVTHVETTSATVSSLVTNTQMVDLPLNGRNYGQLLQLAPAVVPQANTIQQGTTGFFMGNQQHYSISGGRPSGQLYLLDDTNTASFWNASGGSSTTGETLGIDSIAEFEVLTNTYSAQFGGAGAVLNASSKSGTNSFHGTAYEFLRNTAVEATNFYVPTAAPLPVPTLNRNQFGAALGGPIKKNKAFFFFNYEGLRTVQNNPQAISEPDLNARGCEGMTVQACQADGGVGPGPYELFNRAGQPVVITPPPCNGGFTGGVANFPNSAYPLGNGCTAQDSVRAYLSLLPVCQAQDNPGTGTGVCNANNFLRTSENYELGRFDYTLSPKDTIFARFVSDRGTVIVNGLLGGQNGAGSAPYIPETAISNDYYVTIEERRTFSPTLLNTVRVSYVRTGDYTYQYGQPTVNPSAIGIQPFANCGNCLVNSPAWYFGISSNFNQNLTGQPVTTPFPSNQPLVTVNGRESGAPNFGNPSASGAGIAGSAVAPTYLIPNNWTIGDDVFWTHGAHSFKFGGSVIRMDENTWAPFQTGASWSGNGTAVQIGPDGTPGASYGLVGAPLAGFLAGESNPGNGELPNQLLLAAGLPTQDGTLDVRETLFAAYIQDDWKATSRLTVNLGLRYEPTLDPSMVNHINENLLNAPFVSTNPNSLMTTTVASGVGAYPAGTNCAATITTNSGPNGTPVSGLPLGCGWVPISHVFQHNISLRNWDPRIGLAWDPFRDHKTSVRAGFGIFHTLVLARDYDMWLQPPYLAGTESMNNTSNVGANAQTYVAPGSPSGYPFIFQSVNQCASKNFPTSGPGSAVNGGVGTAYTNCLNVAAGGSTYYNWNTTPYVMQWNANVQREVLPGTVVSIGYVGSRGIDLVSQRDYNPLTPCGGTDPATNSPIYTQGYSSAIGAYLPCQRLNPDIQGLQLLNATVMSWYNSLQLSANRRFSHGFLLQVSYAFAKSLDTNSESYGGSGGGVVIDPYNYNAYKGLSTFNRYQNWHINGVYQLPFKKNQLVAGWQLSGIWSYLSGLPTTATGVTGNPGGLAGNSNAFSGYGTTVNVVPGCNPYTGVSPQQAVNQYISGPNIGLQTNPFYNANCFTPVAPGELGNEGRDVLIGPGGWDLDLSVIKDTKITKISENFVLQFRFDAFNALNHPYWLNTPTVGLWNLCTSGNAPYGAAAACGTVGQIQTTPTSSAFGPNFSSGSFGQLGNPTSPRQIQFSLRASF